MKSFKEYLKHLAEDKVIAKEDEGAAPVGDVSSPSTTEVPSGDVQASSPRRDGSLSTTDILGKCDHKHDGFFGPGCFHRPFPVFTLPLKRIKRKKRKYIKVLDLTESDEYAKFNPVASKIISEEINDANRYLQKLGMKCFYESDYPFTGSKENWVGAIDLETQDDANEFGIALNLPAIYGFLEENSLENDEMELRCQIRATIYHEIGHAIVSKFKDDEVYDFEMTDGEEEDLVEEFARYMMREYTGKTTSKLNDFINEIFGENLNEDDLDESNSIIRGNFMKKPINLNHPQRKMGKNFINSKDFGKILPDLKNIQIKKEENLFSDNKYDFNVSISDRGFVTLVPIVASDSNTKTSNKPEYDGMTKMYFDTPESRRTMFLQILSNPNSSVYDRMSTNGQMPPELEDMYITAMEMSDGDRQKAISDIEQKIKDNDTAKQAEDSEKQKQQNSIAASIYCIRATVADILRIVHGKKKTLPLSLLILVDDRENKLDYRYDESQEYEPNDFKDLVSESYNDQLPRLCRAIKDNRDHFRQERLHKIQDLVGFDFSNPRGLGDIVYVMQTTVKNQHGGHDDAVDYITSKAVAIGMDGMDRYNMTCMFYEPTDIIYKLKHPDNVIIYGNDNVDNVPVELLWNGLMNVVNGNSYAGHNERRTISGRATGI